MIICSSDCPSRKEQSCPVTRCVFQPLAVRPFRFCLSFWAEDTLFSGWYSANEGAVTPGHFCPRCDPSDGYFFLSRVGAWGQFLLRKRDPFEPWGAALHFCVKHCIKMQQGVDWDRDLDAQLTSSFKNTLVAQLNGTAGRQPPAISSFTILLSFQPWLLLFSGQLYPNMEQETSSRAELVPQPGTAFMGNLGFRAPHGANWLHLGPHCPPTSSTLPGITY